MKSLARWMDVVCRIALWTAGIGLVLMTAFIFAQVFWRYILNDSLTWSEPASVMIMGWFIFLGAAVGIREGYHLSFDVLLYLLPQRGKEAMHTISDLFVAAFGGGMIFYGSQLALKTAGNAIPSLGISGAFDFIPIAAGGVLVLLFSIERVLRRAAGLSTARFGEAEVED
ncbi:TRAP transporter small permease [Ciceribacter sp. L1K23]|uniref:TRAP transporter small permease n=1 Tax=unclassified Ciceribacter TaxID=2628820 RepID=UPI001ABEA593|nr:MULTISPECIES: TRAP transporter small permease [unclassified Ciceribacter]MBO3762138.1 TRAP transporter small permease [Ciceribacter sp. L1K22]MBR0558016.1 TRAP transporter small permease [Ciceribacter sp. L1K23]